MIKVNLLKRLESSVDSFRLTLRRTIEKIDRLEAHILSRLSSTSKLIPNSITTN